MSGAATRAAWLHIRGKDISIPARLVLLALADRHNQETGRCDPSIARIVCDTRLSERAVRTALRELEAAKAVTTVERQQRTGRGKRNMTNRYKISGIKGGAQYAGGMGHNMPPNLNITPTAFGDLAFPLGGDDE
jgi:DNA-binding transcriptional ArsR family regulator